MPKIASHYLEELLAPWARIEIKRMFGGLGAWRDGLFFALIVDDLIYFKVDETNRPDYVAAQSEPFSYTVTKGSEKNIKIIDGLWRIPDEVLEDGDTLIAWAQKAWDVARSKPKKASKTKKSNALGPKSAAWLKSVGITSQADLEANGAIATYCLLKAKYPKDISLNMLWGLYAQVNHISLSDITPDLKDHLKQLLKSARV